MPEHSNLLIYGASGFGREVAAWAERASWGDRPVRVLGFIDDQTPERSINGRRVSRLNEAARLHAGTFVVVAVGRPELRERLVARAEAAGLTTAPPLIHPSVEYDRDHVSIGDGTVLCPGTTLTTNIEIGRHVQINLHCTVAHDVELGDFVTLSPGCHISGRVKVGRGAFAGTGVVTLNGEADRPLVIGEGAVLGAGAAVIKDVPPNVMVFGVPARSLASSASSEKELDRNSQGFR
jgi:sugar O-acyltransferase (sialic acid O-acetyltransferase NeuD family)